MMDFSTDKLKKTYDAGAQKFDAAVSTVKDITVRPKLDAALHIKSKKQKDEIFGFDFHFDKEIPLLKIIGIAAGILAAIIALSALTDALFGKKCCCKNSEDCND